MPSAYQARMDGRPLDNGVHWLDERKRIQKEKHREGLKRYWEQKRQENIEAIKKEIQLLESLKTNK